METAKTGSKLAQLQALRGQKLAKRPFSEMVHAAHSNATELLAEIKRLRVEIAKLEAQNRLLQAQIVALRDVRPVTPVTPVTIMTLAGPVTRTGQPKTAAERMRAMRARRKKK